MEDEKWPSAFLVSEVAEKQISCFLYTNFSPFLLQEKQVLLYLLMLADEKWPFAFLIVEKQINVSWKCYFLFRCFSATWKADFTWAAEKWPSPFLLLDPRKSNFTLEYRLPKSGNFVLFCFQRAASEGFSFWNTSKRVPQGKLTVICFVCNARILLDIPWNLHWRIFCEMPRRLRGLHKSDSSSTADWLTYHEAYAIGSPTLEQHSSALLHCARFLVTFTG